MSVEPTDTASPMTRKQVAETNASRYTHQKNGRAVYTACRCCGNVTWHSTDLKLPPESVVTAESGFCGVCEEFRFKHPEVFEWITMFTAYRNLPSGWGKAL